MSFLNTINLLFTKPGEGYANFAVPDELTRHGEPVSQIMMCTSDTARNGIRPRVRLDGSIYPDNMDSLMYNVPVNAACNGYRDGWQDLERLGRSPSGVVYRIYLNMAQCGSCLSKNLCPIGNPLLRNSIAVIIPIKPLATT